MLSRTIVLLIGVYLAIANASKNLRYETVTREVDVKDVPVDHERAARGLAYLKANLLLAAKSDGAHAKKTVAHAQAHVNSRAKTLHEHSAKSKLSLGKRTEYAEPPRGSLVMRHRPNGDCSGMVSLLIAQDMGGCLPTDYPGIYFLMTCAGPDHDKDEYISLKSEIYDNEYCMGQPLNVEIDHTFSPRCGLNADDDDDEPIGPEMIATQCVGRNKWSYLSAETPGMLMSQHAEGDMHCNAEPIAIGLFRFGGCDLVYEYYNDKGRPVDHPTKNPLNSFYYARVDSCDPSGSLKFTAYSDSSCLRPMFRSSEPVPLGMCEDGMMFTCPGGRDD